MIKFRTKFKSMKIRTQFILLILCAGILAFLLFEVLWQHKWEIGSWLYRKDLHQTQLDNTHFLLKLTEEAENYDIPSSEKDIGQAGELEHFFKLADAYTALYIYEVDNGMFRAGHPADIMYNPSLSRGLLSLGYLLTDGTGEQMQVIPLHFRNGLAIVMAYNYQHVLFLCPWLIGCLLLSAFLFCAVVLFFISRKMKSILVLEREVLTMSSGDLTHPVPDFGGDEIGTLAKELNGLRNSLRDHILTEQESRKANQDLITALSHDLRTPLTILNGYLEVLKLKRNPDQRENYLMRCLKKTEELKELTDRMFEYALVYEENEIPEFSWISTNFICQCLLDNCDYIRLTGFSPCPSLPSSAGVLESDRIMLKRIFNNLFSNILKYGEKKSPVQVTAEIQKQKYIIQITNRIKQEHSRTGSNNIGLKSVQKMMQLLDGEMDIKKESDTFTVLLFFPLR